MPFLLGLFVDLIKTLFYLIIRMYKNCEFLWYTSVTVYLRIIVSRKNRPYRNSVSKKATLHSTWNSEARLNTHVCQIWRGPNSVRNDARSIVTPIVALINSQQITRRGAERRTRAERATILVANRKAPRDPTKAPSKGPLSFPSVPRSTSFFHLLPAVLLFLFVRPLSSFPSSLRVPFLRVRRSVFLSFLLCHRVLVLSFSLSLNISHFSTPSPLSYKH